MNNYVVSLAIDVEASSPEEAAEIAHFHFLYTPSWPQPWVFVVQDEIGKWVVRVKDGEAL